jgi:hypothetical protein
MRLRAFSSFVVGAFAVMSVHMVAAAEPTGKLVSAAMGPPAEAPNLLGELTKDLVYTPITPCRIVDTRATASGPIAANATRSFIATAAANYASQGGSSSDCGTAGLNAAVVMVVATAVTPTAPGSAIVYPFGASKPAAASMQFATGSIAVNTLAVQVPNPPTSFGFTVYTSAQSDFVFDIIGYFAPPLATALDITTVSGTPTNVAAGAYSSLPTLYCPATYTPMGLAISAAENILVADTYTAGNAAQIFVRSLSANAQNVTAKLSCGRVPGR